MNISNDGNHMLSGGAQVKYHFQKEKNLKVQRVNRSYEDLSVGAQKTDCSRDMLGGYANPGILDNREDDIENLQQVNNIESFALMMMVANREDGNENSLQVNDIASYALMMIAIATLLMTFTLNIKTYIPNKSKVQLFGLSMKTVDIVCTIANEGLCALWWGLLKLTNRIRPYRVGANC
ncbi:hypothetical protein Pyn_19777 [Prunus yedoensis var. nudiflora]|uniref:Uncharacterized protein n=1 Tax=Prunus yedoensis var. nudiflora TaxID=2094558 RepID=A0A314Z8N0_PRUYE|nr:hypothetical protein Pyn_19777 [Prunus yedoensis var. nudiflora]